MRAPRSFDLLSVHCLWPGPALWGSQHDHRPLGQIRSIALAGIALNAANLLHNVVERRGHQLMHLLRLMSLQEVSLPPVSGKQFCEVVIGHPAQDSRIGDLVSVQM